VLLLRFPHRDHSSALGALLTVRAVVWLWRLYARPGGGLASRRARRSANSRSVDWDPGRPSFSSVFGLALLAAWSARRNAALRFVRRRRSRGCCPCCVVALACRVGVHDAGLPRSVPGGGKRHGRQRQARCDGHRQVRLRAAHTIPGIEGATATVGSAADESRDAPV